VSVVDLLVDECPVDRREQQNNDQLVHKSKCVETTNEQEKWFQFSNFLSFYLARSAPGDSTAKSLVRDTKWRELKQMHLLKFGMLVDRTLNIAQASCLP
jgi:hypothetical protein